MKLGDKLNFNFAKGKEFEVKEIIENANLPISWDWKKGICPHCNKEIVNTKEYTIDEIVITEDSEGNLIKLGYTKELVSDKPLTMRLPDKDFYKEKDMSSVINSKSKYLKEVK